MTYHFIYKTTNLINGRYYYGVHSTKMLDDDYLGSGTILTAAIKKYGRKNFKREILALFDERSEAFKAEADLVDQKMLTDIKCYNIKTGGLDGFSPTVKLRGDNRTKNQKMAAIEHSKRQSGKKPYNAKSIELFGLKFDSIAQALKHYGLSTSQYYYMIKNSKNFSSAQELKENSWKDRNRKISTARKLNIDLVHLTELRNAGYTIKKIAEILNISISSVKKYLKTEKNSSRENSDDYHLKSQ